MTRKYPYAHLVFSVGEAGITAIACPNACGEVYMYGCRMGRAWRGCVLWLLLLAAAIGLSVRAASLNADGHPQRATSAALAVVVSILALVVGRPRLRPPLPPQVAVTNRDARPGEVYGHDHAGRMYTRDAQGQLYRYDGMEFFARMPPQPPPPRLWNGAGRALIVVAWLATGILAGYASYYVSGVLDRGFNLILLECAAVRCLLLPLAHGAQQLAGFPGAWDRFRGSAGWRLLANSLIGVTLAGFSFVVVGWIESVVTGVPRHIYRSLDGWWHVPWLNVFVVIVVCLLLMAILGLIFGSVKRTIARALGRDNPVDDVLDEVPVVSWQPPPHRPLGLW